ncbi:MAG: hypothetical protein JO343_01170 [Candidatus Eremiobacteraeota bacterium]|nr:hypothetical protein [Candidatus Eremiobacteraeota bacterium]MBV8668201.1 hypothetical protein [Candidatus Eremiobacteraeota bacterium]MBV8671317.1 hypothetical protein [Candidatus Eremiobacteraeota bacterium]
MAMKPVTFAVPNSVSAVLYEIERLRLNRSLSELSCRLLQMFYVVGWDDGFMVVDRGDVGGALGVRTHELNRAIAELEALDLIALRALPHDAAGRDVVEILAMSTAEHSGLQQICWWDYYRVQLADYFLDPGEEP